MSSRTKNNFITISFPDQSPAEATSLAKDLEVELIECGAQADQLRVLRSNSEAMDLGTTLVILGELADELLPDLAKGAIIGVGSFIGQEIAKAVSGRINQFCQKRRTVAKIEASNGKSETVGSEPVGALPERATSLSELGKLGIVVFGASRYPHFAIIDDPANARSAAAVKDLFTPQTTTFQSIEVLDLFDSEAGPAELVHEIEQHLDQNPDADGSIEADMPDGTMHFESTEALRQHLENHSG